jgi:hypothetical protein
MPMTECRLEAAPDLTIVSWLSALPKLDTEDRLEEASPTFFDGEMKLNFSQLAGVAGRDVFGCRVGLADSFLSRSASACEVYAGVAPRLGNGSAISPPARLIFLGVADGVYCRRRCWLGNSSRALNFLSGGGRAMGGEGKV